MTPRVRQARKDISRLERELSPRKFLQVLRLIRSGKARPFYGVHAVIAAREKLRALGDRT